MDPCCSWFGYRQVGLKGHTSAALLSQWPFPRSEQSASEHLEEPETALVTGKQHKHGWKLHFCDYNSKVIFVAKWLEDRWCSNKHDQMEKKKHTFNAHFC